MADLKPKIIWEGKGRQSGQDYVCRGVLLHKEEQKWVTFEYTDHEDRMGVRVWRDFGGIPDQFVRDSAVMMDTAFVPNRRGAPIWIEGKTTYLVQYRFHDTSFCYAVDLNSQERDWVEATFTKSRTIHHFEIKVEKILTSDDFTEILRQEGVLDA